MSAFELIVTALALVLVVEGLMPSLAPALYQRLLAHLSQQNASSLRISGLIMMSVGALILLWLRGGS